MSQLAQVRVVIEDDSQVGEARRLAATLSRHAGLGDAAAGKVSIIVSELGTNVRKHARSGELLLRELAAGNLRAVEVVALDKGPGMNLDVSMRDGHSTVGTRGEGLGAIRRLAHLFDAWSEKDRGTVAVARVWGGEPPSSPVEIGAVCQPLKGEPLPGDGWDYEQRGAVLRALVVDGLGHGPIAARAAEEAVRAFRQNNATAPTPESLIDRIHSALRPTRGAAVAVAEVDLVARELRFCGVGNIAAAVEAPGHRARGLMSHNGIAGHEARRIQQFVVPWPPRATLIIHSDGISSQWKLEAYPGLAQHHPSLIAAALYRDYRRPTDDATVVVVKEP